ncbi:hypothetical protein [Polaromonas sp.]|uniref:hypothetical protein n=1 Tax=Polaromonas sp. TaxID=1869339 RepID=UPI0032635A7C
MTIPFDWKFWVVLVATLAGVLIPVWLWRADLEARSLHIRKLSQTSLQPPDTAKALDLQVSLAGVELQTPYLTVFELVNDGARPIPATDFESPLEITSANKAEIVRSSVTNAKPADITPSLSVVAGTLKIMPMLMNPGDSVTIAVLTTKEEPFFVSKARIAGVRAVPILDTDTKPVSPVRSAVMALAALICCVAANLVVSAWPSAGVTLRPRASFVVFMVSTLGGALLLTATLDGFGIHGFLPLLVIFLVCIVLTGLVAARLNRSSEAKSKIESA